MLIKRRLVTIAIWLLIFGLTGTQVNAGTPQYRFAYVTYTNSGVAVNLIDIQHPAESPQQIIIADAINYVILTNRSPDGHWGIFLLYNREMGAFFRLVDMLTGEIRDIATTYWNDDYRDTERDYAPHWSPDSHYVALNIYKVVDGDTAPSQSLI